MARQAMVSANLDLCASFIKERYLTNRMDDQDGFYKIHEDGTKSKLVFREFYKHLTRFAEQSNHWEYRKSGTLSAIRVSKQMKSLGLETKRWSDGKRPETYLPYDYKTIYNLFQNKGWIFEIDHVLAPEDINMPTVAEDVSSPSDKENGEEPMNDVTNANSDLISA